MRARTDSSPAGNRAADVTTLATMWQRLAGHYSSLVDGKTPLSYSLLVLPPKSELAAISVSDDKYVWGSARDHPYASWTNKSFPRSVTLNQALTSLERENSSNQRLLKMRLSFTDGLSITLMRSNVSDASSLRAVDAYDPSAVFTSKTQSRSSASRSSLLRNLEPLSDLITGRSVSDRMPTVTKRSESSLSHSRLYRDCPPPHKCQPGFQFTPMSHNTFLMRPNTFVKGCRPSIGNTNPQAVHFRPRAFQRQDPATSCHYGCAERSLVGQHNDDPCATVDLAEDALYIDHRNQSPAPLKKASSTRSRSNLSNSFNE